MMRNKIALEEHFAVDLTIDQSKNYAPPEFWPRLKANLPDIETLRLERMEQGGTSYSILSLNSPGIQSPHDPKNAIDVAQSTIRSKRTRTRRAGSTTARSARTTARRSAARTPPGCSA